MNRYRERAAILFDFPSGRYGFIAGVRGNLTIDGQLFVGSGAVIDIENPEASIDLANADLTITLASHRRVNGGWQQLFDPYLLTSIEEETWYRRPAIVYRIVFDAQRRPIQKVQLFRREVFQIEHLKGKVGRRIRGTLSTPAAFAKIIEGKTRGPELQRLIDPTDRGYDSIARAAIDPIIWGPQQRPLGS